MFILNIKKELEKMKNNLYLVTRLEPDFRDRYTIISLKPQDNYFDALDVIKNEQLLRRVNYGDIRYFDIDDIITNMKFSDGTVCLLEKRRNDLEEILKDFNKDNICISYKNEIIFINNYKIIRNNNKLIIEGYKFDKINEVISNELVKFPIDLNNIIDIEEEYYDQGWGKEVKIHTKKRFFQLSCM